MCIYIYIYTLYIYIYIYIYVYMHYTHSLSLYIYIYTHISLSIHIYIYICSYNNRSSKNGRVQACTGPCEESSGGPSPISKQLFLEPEGLRSFFVTILKIHSKHLFKIQVRLPESSAVSCLYFQTAQRSAVEQQGPNGMQTSLNGLDGAGGSLALGQSAN